MSLRISAVINGILQKIEPVASPNPPSNVVDRDRAESALEAGPDSVWTHPTQEGRALSAYLHLASVQGPHAAGSLPVPSPTALYLAHATPTVARAARAASVPATHRPPNPFALAGYRGIPTQEGTLNVEGSHSRAISNWIRDLREADLRGPARKAADDLEATKQVFAETMSETGTAVEKALERDLRSGAILRLDKESGGRVIEYMRDYELWSGRAAQYRERNAAAEAAVDAAFARVTAAEKRMSADDLRAGKNAEQAKRAEIQARIERRGQNLSLAIDVATDFATGPMDATRKYTIDMMERAAIELLNEDDLRKLAEIDGRIAGLDAQIKASESDALREDLMAARKDLVAAKHDLLAASLAHSHAERMAFTSVQNLKTLEKEYPGTTTVFSKLAEHYEQMVTMGRTLARHNHAYLGALDSAPFNRGDEIRARVADDRGTVMRVRRDDRNGEAIDAFELGASEIDRYARSVEGWRQAEIERHEDLQDRLEAGAHLSMVGNVMHRIRKDGLGQARF